MYNVSTLPLHHTSLFLSAGCRGAIVVAEARSADEPVLTRRCVVMKVADFSTEKYLQAQRQNAAAVLILLPKNISSLPQESIQVRTGTDATEGERRRSVSHCFAFLSLFLFFFLFASPSW